MVVVASAGADQELDVDARVEAVDVDGLEVRADLEADAVAAGLAARMDGAGTPE